MTTTIYAEGQWAYADACATLYDLRDEGIEAGMTGGGLWLLLSNKDQAQSAKAIVEKHGGWLCAETFTQGLDMQTRSRQDIEATGTRQAYIKGLTTP